MIYIFDSVIIVYVWRKIKELHTYDNKRLKARWFLISNAQVYKKVNNSLRNLCANIRLRNSCNESVDESISLRTYCRVLLACIYICELDARVRERGRKKGRKRVSVSPRALHMCRCVQKSGKRSATSRSTQSSTNSQ